MAARAWFLNLDADLELGSGPRYEPTRVVLDAMRPHVERLARDLLDDGDVLVDERSEPNVARGLRGRAFCPTPRAIALLSRSGAHPEPHPPVEVLRLVNGRAFCASLGQTLPEAEFVTDLRVAMAKLGRVTGEWRVKRAFGMAGRGQRVLRPEALTDADRAFVEAGVKDGGVQIEPNVTIVDELALHGMLGQDGVLERGRIVSQRCDAHGQWLESVPAVDVDPVIAALLEAERARVAAALQGVGYFGPFGVDAFTYVGPDGDLRLRRRSEINARYSMGFPVGMPRKTKSSVS